MASQALAGVRVLEYCCGISGPYCTKLMGDLGAEVVHVEAPAGGDDTRRLPPFLGDDRSPEKSGLFLFLNNGKLGITLDAGSEAGRQIFRRLAESADVLVEDRPPQEMESLGLDYEALRALNPGLVMASITPFGRSGPYKDYTAHGLNISHASGQGYMLPVRSPHLERAPVKIGGHCTEYDCGQAAALAVLAALFSRQISGRGQFVEVSQQEAVLSLQRIENVVYANGGEILTRKGPATDTGITVLYQCRDGYVVSVTPQDHQQEALARLADAEAGPSPHAEDGAVQSVRERLAAWARERTMEEVCAKAQSFSCPMSPVGSPQDVARSPQMTSRRFFAEVEHPAAGRLQIPARFCHFSRTPIQPSRPAPMLGQHNDLVYRQRLGYGTDELSSLQQRGVI